MKKIVIIIFALWAGLTLSAQENNDKKRKNEKVTFTVNMYCENCKTKIEKNISWEKGVKDLTVNLEKKTVTIVYTAQKTTEESLKKAIEKLGYTVGKETP